MRIKKFNWINAALSYIIFILEVAPNSVIITSSNGMDKVNIYYVSYFTEPNLWLHMVPLIPFIIALFTICVIILNTVSVIEDDKKRDIISIVFSSICFIGSLMYVIIMEQYITAHNLIIMLLFLLQIVLLGIKLRVVKNEKSNKN